MSKPYIARLIRLFLLRLGSVVAGWMLTAGAALGASSAAQCYAAMPTAPDIHATRALYILIDQTTPLTEAMTTRIVALVSHWGRQGDRVKIARFSANIRGRYPELVFDEFVEPQADEAYLYNLRYTDKVALSDCLAHRKEEFNRRFNEVLRQTLSEIDRKIPKTDLFYSLRELAANVMQLDDAPQKTVLIVSDGLENSAATSFYRGGAIRLVDPRKEMALLRRHKLLANWKGAEIYMYGIGLSPDRKGYLNPARLDALKGFWERYFVEGNGLIRTLGVPEILVTAID